VISLRQPARPVDQDQGPARGRALKGTKQFFGAGNSMFATTQSHRQIARPALRVAAMWLALILVIVSGVHAESWSAPDQVAMQSGVADKTPDCPIAEGASGAAHCQIMTYGVPDASVALPPLPPATGSNVWRYGEATSGPILVSHRLFRPPISLRAHT
jgi:hypothetical protein